MTTPTPTTDLAIDEINPGSFDFWMRDDVDGALAVLRRERPIAWHQHRDSNKGFWSLTRYRDISAASRDWETFSSHWGIMVITDPDDSAWLQRRSMISLDPPKHTKLRSLVTRTFTPRVLQRLEESMRQRAREIIDEIAPKGEVDFVPDVAVPMPFGTISDILGVPDADRPRLIHLMMLLFGGGDAELGANRTTLQQASDELRDYGVWLGKQRLENPQDDLTTHLVRAEIDSESLPTEDLGPFVSMLIAAGADTTRNALSHAIWALTQWPEEKRRWLEDIEGHAKTAAEEIVRWATPVLHMRRTLTRDVTFGGVDMKEGDKVAMWYASANRDEERFEDPFRFDITRDPNKHGGYGTEPAGPHYCLGANLARQEIVALMTELLRRLPDIEATSKPEKVRSNFMHGVKRLKVRFTPVG